MLSPVWRTRLFGGGASAMALWLGFEIAQGQYFFPAVIAAGLLVFLLGTWQPFPISAWLLGAALFGYIVGNRGFAQFTLVPGFPLLPAEAVLMGAGALLLVQAAWRHELPFRREALHGFILAWIAFGAARMVFDVRTFGMMALRDFATVYYAMFFFLAQEIARVERHRRALLNVILVSCVVLFATSRLYDQNPAFFHRVIALRGLPLIFYKGDLVGTFLAVGSALLFLRYERTRRWWLVPLSLLLAGGMLFTNNRASMVGLGVAAIWLALGRRWRFAAALAGSGIAAALVILTAATLMNRSWETTPVFGVYERIVSLIDPGGKRVYRGEDTSYKGDNNLFRTVWWGAVIDETVEGNPYLGLGFGHDIAARFVREYLPESGEEFSTRSPHNVLLTIFARMGTVGLALFLLIVGAMVRRTWHAVRAGPDDADSWCAAWIVLVSACFGVVLEGPMGAVVFWTLLGLGRPRTTVSAETGLPPTASLPASRAATEVPALQP